MYKTVTDLALRDGIDSGSLTQVVRDIRTRVAGLLWVSLVSGLDFWAHMEVCIIHGASSWFSWLYLLC